MRQTNAFRLCSRAGCEDDLDEIVGLDRCGRIGCVSVMISVKKSKRETWISVRGSISESNNFAETCSCTRATKSGADFRSSGTTTAPRNKHPKNAATHSRAVLTPEQHPIAAPQSPLFKLTRELKRPPRNLSVRPPDEPQSPLVHDSRFSLLSQTVVKKT